ncbi:MAG: VWA domain-containing protein [Acidobacteriota bacterium]
MHRPRLLPAATMLAALIAPTAALWRAPGAAADDRPAGAAPAPLVERATSEMVLIEAYVTGRDGRPVRGLTVSDFVLKVDRRAKPISSFEHVVIVPSSPEEAPSPAGGRPPSAAHRGARALPRRLVLFFEDATSRFENLTQARLAAERFVRSGLAPTDEVAIVAYDPNRRLEVLSDFTTDREGLRAAIRKSLEDARRFSDFASRQEDRRDEILRTSRGALRGGSARAAVSLAATFAREDTALMAPVLRALANLIDALAAWPGYKGIIFVGAGIPEYPGADYWSPTIVGRDRFLLDIQSFNLSAELKALARSAAASGVALHSVQTSGLVPGTSARTPGHVGLRHSPQQSAFRRENSLKNLALNSGGISSTSNDILEGLERIERGSREYYVLGYVPEGPPDGLYHSVTVKVRIGGARVRHRDGFIRLTPDEALERRIEAAHLLPELHSDLPLEIAAVPGPGDSSSRTTDIVLYVAEGEILFVPHGSRRAARIEVGLVGLDAGGRETYRAARRIRVAVPAGAGPSLGLDLVSRITLPVRDQTITAVLSDLQSGAIGAARLGLSRSDLAEQRLVGLSIYALNQTALWIEFDRPEAGEEQERLADYEQGPALRARFAPGEPLACAFRLPHGALPAAAEFDLQILKDHRVVRSKPLVIEDGQTGVIKATLPTEGLADGSYVLSIRERSDAGGRERGRLGFRIGPDGRAVGP